MKFKDFHHWNKWVILIENHGFSFFFEITLFTKFILALPRKDQTCFNRIDMREISWISYSWIFIIEIKGFSFLKFLDFQYWNCWNYTALVTKFKLDQTGQDQTCFNYWIKDMKFWELQIGISDSYIYEILGISYMKFQQLQFWQRWYKDVRHVLEAQCFAGCRSLLLHFYQQELCWLDLQLVYHKTHSDWISTALPHQHHQNILDLLVYFFSVKQTRDH